MTPFDAMVAQDQEDRLPWFYVVPLSRLAGSGMEALVARIEELPYDFPPGTKAVQLSSVLPEKRAQVADMADRVTPICDSDLVDLLRAFLEHKRAEGSSIERELYARTGPCQLFTRLLCQRPLSFWTPQDKYVFPSTEGKRQLRGSWAWKARCATRILWQMVNLREKRRIQALASSQGQTINHSPHDPEQAQPSTGPRSEALASSQGQVRGVDRHRARYADKQVTWHDEAWCWQIGWWPSWRAYAWLRSDRLGP